MRQIITMDTQMQLSVWQIRHFWEAFNQAWQTEPGGQLYHVGDAEGSCCDQFVSVFVEVDSVENKAIMTVSAASNT